jgi:hypothetical protein
MKFEALSCALTQKIFIGNPDLAGRNPDLSSVLMEVTLASLLSYRKPFVFSIFEVLFTIMAWAPTDLVACWKPGLLLTMSEIQGHF